MRPTVTGTVVVVTLLLSAVGGCDRAAASEGLRPTTATSIGIFYQPGAPAVTTLWRPGDPGQRLQLRGRVLTTGGAPVSNALVELWHADGAGSVDESRYRTSQRTGEDGYFGIKTVLPGHIEMAAGNDVFGARHIHIVVTHPDHERLVSLIYFKGDERLATALYPELAITLDETGAGDEAFLFGVVEIVLP
ncbi:MAG: hypothetical protein OET44_07820 [Gammaproteobacteria bacterium]|nr:hypothetical protein [Gammaproteobacteria bacterium]